MLQIVDCETLACGLFSHPSYYNRARCQGVLSLSYKLYHCFW